MIGAKTVKAEFLFGICDISDQILMASSTRTRTSKDMDRVIKMAYAYMTMVLSVESFVILLNA